jgi:hypothetical protein
MRNLRAQLALVRGVRSRWVVPNPAAFLGPSVAPASGGHLFVRAPMSRVPWQLLQERQQRAHLVVAVLRADQLGGEPNPRAAQIVLARIVKIQKPSGYYATTVVRHTANIDKSYKARDACLAQHASAGYISDSDPDTLAHTITLACSPETEQLVATANRDGDSKVAAAIRQDSKFRAKGYVLKARGQLIF